VVEFDLIERDDVGVEDVARPSTKIWTKISAGVFSKDTAPRALP